MLRVRAQRTPVQPGRIAPARAWSSAWSSIRLQCRPKSWN